MVLNNQSIFPKSFPHGVSVQPISYSGIGCLDLNTEEGLGTVETIIKSLQTPVFAQSIITFSKSLAE